MNAVPPTAAEHLTTAEALIRKIEAGRGHLRDAVTEYELDKTLAQLHIAAANCLTDMKVAEKHVELVDILTAFSLDAHDAEDIDHGPDSWPPIPPE